MAANPNVTSFRGKDWLFNALWAPGSDPTAPKCTVRIPLTILFHQGQPFKGLETNDSTGYVQRINFEEAGLELERSVSEVRLAGDGNRMMRIMRKLLKDYAEKNKYYTSQKIEEPYICSVTYTDGEREDVNLRTFDILLRNEPWRMQVLIMQGYVPTISKANGRYSDDGVKKVRSLLESDGAAAADKLTKALSKYAEKIYATTAGGAATLGRSRAAAQAAADKLGRKAPVEMKLVVKELHATFALDSTDTVVFLYSDFTTVELDSGRREVEDFLVKERSGRENSAAKAVYKELQSLLQHAQKRGLSTAESFVHFDTQRNGFVDTDLLVDGLGRLGIGVTYQVAEMVLELIGGLGAAFLSIQDFDRFLRVPSDVSSFSTTNLGDSSLSSSMTSPNKKNNKVSTAAADDVSVASSQLYPPSKQGAGSPSPPGSPNRQSDSLSLEASQQFNWDLSELSAASSSLKSHSKGIPPTGSKKQGELPIPEHMYTSNAPTDKSIQLPSWTSKRNKKALKELRSSHDKWSEKKASEGSVATSGYETKSTSSAARNASPTRSSSPSGTKPSSRGGSRGASRGASKKAPGLSLVNIRKEMSHKQGKSPDELLHLESGVIMTFRVIVGKGHKDIKTHEETEVFRYKSILEVRERNLNEIGAKVHGGVDGQQTSQEAAMESKESKESESKSAYATASSDGKPDRWVAFTLVLIPDLFMTLDALENALGPLLTKYPHARIVCVGLPGLPNTVWQNGWVLSPDLHARSISMLLQHLKQKHRLAQYLGEPVFIMSFGTGAHSMSRFINMYLPGLPWLESSLKAMVVVNGVLKLSKAFKQTCRDLRNSMMTATAHETNELITALHFWDQYLLNNDRETCLKNFWLPRRGLVADGFGDEKHGQGFIGVLEMLKAILVQPDDFDGALILATDKNYPVLVVQSTEDIFVNPRTAALYQADRLPPERTLVKDIADCLDEGAVHVSWLKAGHEVLQERTPFVLGLVSNLAQVCGIHPSEERAVEVDEENEDIFDVLEMAAKKRAASKAAEDAAAEEEKIRLKEEVREEKRKRREEKEARKEEERLAIQKQVDEEERLAQEKAAEDAAAIAATGAALAQPSEEEEVVETQISEAERRERNILEKERRAKLAVERRRREAREKRRAAMEIFYERERLEKERKQEERDTIKMIKEDRRSKFAEDYRREQANNARSRRLAQKKAEALKAARREEAIKRVEEKMNRERAQRSEQRRQKAEEAVKAIQAEVLTLTGEAQGGYDVVPEGRDPHGVMALIISCHRVITDLMECRQKSIESMRRQVLVEEKFNVFRKQCQSVEHEARMLRQAIRMIENNPSLVGQSGGSKDAREELFELRRNLFAKEETYSELTAVSKAREAQLSAANRSVQMLKMAIRERDELMNTKISAMQELEESLSNEARALRNQREHLIEQRDKVKLRLLLVNEKVKQVQGERQRIASHKGKLVDSDAWVGGVMQRAHTKELKSFLKQSHKQEEDKAQAIRDELAVFRDKIFEIDDRIHATKRDADKIGVACRSFLRTFKNISAVSVVDVMKNLSHQQETAEKGEERKNIEGRLKGLMNDQHALRDGDVDHVQVLRLKDFDLRTKDERKYVGMDLILNPEAYLHISMVEAEQMRFDNDYQCDLAKTDLERIKNLPEQISLAMPFLHTPSEVTAHRLFNKFNRGLTDEEFASKDRMYEGGSFEDDDSTADDGQDPVKDSSNGITAQHLADAEIIHDILVKEARRDRVRAKGAGEDMAEEDRNWLQIDRVLNPMLFGVKSTDTYEDMRAMIENNFSTSVLKLAPNDRITVPSEDSKAHQRAMLRENQLTGELEGDVYNELRWRQEDGEVVFDDSWRCTLPRSKIMEIRSRISMDGATEEELMIRRLLDKFYVSDDECTLGHARLHTLHHTLHKVTSFIAESDKEAECDARVKYIERTALRLLDGVKPTDQTEVDDAKMKAAQQKKKIVDGKGRIKRLWGSWEQIHPASGGVESQTSYFMKSAFDPSRDHPAVFGLHDEVLKLDESNILTEKAQMPEGADLQSLAMNTLTALPGQAPMSSANFDTHQNDANSNWLIVENTRELALMEVSRVQGKSSLIAQKQPLVLFNARDVKLEARQSRAHRFELPNRDDARVLDITVSIIFQGNFATKGYKLGRLAAALFRLPDERNKDASPMPEPVGYAPYSMQSPNLPEHLGRVVILHRPKKRPLRPGFFQLVIGTASSTKYSVEVTARIAMAALPIVDKLIDVAKSHQSRLPNLLHELDDLQESLRLAERKMLVCGKMLKEAEAETTRCQRSMAVINHKLEIDDEEMTMLEDERREHERELGILEVEYGQWATVFGSRTREIDDIKEGIKLIFEFQRRRQQEKKKIKNELEDARHDLPACIAALRNITEATNVANALNTTVQGASAAWAASVQGENAGPSLRTPAEEVRRHLKREGFKSLVLEEQQWCMLDQALNPHKYEWLREQEEEENAKRLEMGKPLKPKKYNAAVDAFRIPAAEIKHIMKTPFSMLSRREVIIRKLIVKYHDDPGILAKKFAAVAYGFDPHLAERTRAKMPATYTREDKEWASIDKVLHPEVWAYYVNKEIHKDTTKDATVGGSPAKLALKAAGQEAAGGGAKNGDSQPNHAKFQTASAMGKILGLKGLENEAGGSLEVMVQGAQKTLTAQAKASETWHCPFDRDRIFRIWKSSKHRLTNDDERMTYKLLQKYNGTYVAYMEAIEEKERRAEHGAKAGSHVRWDSIVKTPTVDIDYRAREVLHEIDRATACQNEYMSSDVLHTSDQMFPTVVLRVQLEEELDHILSEQIRDRERAERARIGSDSESDEESDEELAYIDPTLEGEEADLARASMMEKVKKRARRREKRKLKLKGPNTEKEVLAVKKKLNTKGKSGKELEEMVLLNQLGYGGCLACRCNPCRWSTGVDRPVVMARKALIDQEYERVRLMKDQMTIESEVCLSAQQGGNRFFKRMDLIEELRAEQDELERQLHLDDVDKELHDAYASRDEFIEVKSLHGYSMSLWVNNARAALSARQNRLVAISVAKEACDDILDWMLEGWYFGERESAFPVLGRVPSVATDPGGFIRPGQDQIKAVAPVIAKMKKRKEAKKAGVVLPEAARGLMEDKLLPIELQAELRKEKVKIARDGNRHEHMLNETERTLKFGLFMMALMYFRAMTFVKREQRSWAGDDDEITADGKPKVKIMTDERMLMLDEENKARARKKKVDAILFKCKVGEQRRIDRENAERREAVHELQKLVRRQKLELASITHIQRAFRGHLGRKAAKRWALKRAELGAMHALLHSTSICIQRCYRGYLARVNAARKRAEMAAFIALMRAQEAKSDEDVFWATHPWQRFKRDRKEWVDKKLRAAHKVEVLGGARLSEEEQDDLISMRMDQVNDAINDGLNRDSDSDESEVGESHIEKVLASLDEGEEDEGDDDESTWKK